jgi:hypothetical protein
MSELNPYTDVSVVARLSGRAITVAVMNGPLLKLVRCVELPEVTNEEILGMLLPTIAYVEDEMGALPARLLVCGFDHVAGWRNELDVPVEELQSRFGKPNQWNAGLMGFLQSALGGGIKAA